MYSSPSYILTVSHNVTSNIILHRLPSFLVCPRKTTLLKTQTFPKKRKKGNDDDDDQDHHDDHDNHDYDDDDQDHYHDHCDCDDDDHDDDVDDHDDDDYDDVVDEYDDDNDDDYDDDDNMTIWWAILNQVPHRQHFFRIGSQRTNTQTNKLK